MQSDEKCRVDFCVENLSRRDFGTATCDVAIIIFFLTSFFINSIHQLVAIKHRCEIFHEEWKGE